MIIMNPDISISFPIHPTEEIEKLKTAIVNIFPDASVSETETTIQAKAADLSHFTERLKNQQIRDTARSIFLRTSDEGKITFHLNKQAATVDRVNFTDGNSVLGDILVEISGPDISEVIEFLTSKNSGGDAE